MFVQTHLGVNVVRLQKLIERDSSKTYIVLGSITYVCGNPWEKGQRELQSTLSRGRPQFVITCDRSTSVVGRSMVCKKVWWDGHPQGEGRGHENFREILIKRPPPTPSTKSVFKSRTSREYYELSISTTLTKVLNSTHDNQSCTYQTYIKLKFFDFSNHLFFFLHVQEVIGRMFGKRTKQSSITSMGFTLLQKPTEMCVGRQIKVLGSYWKGSMWNEEVNSLYKYTVREYHT
jgi:hypothetical protein